MSKSDVSVLNDYVTQAELAAELGVNVKGANHDRA